MGGVTEATARLDVLSPSETPPTFFVAGFFSDRSVEVLVPTGRRLGGEMIRREIDLGDGTPRWLLVSQIEHGRLSRLLAEQCLDHFGRETLAAADPAEVRQVQHELLSAILHHDDGWAEWEMHPRLDPEWHRPLSFRELPLSESIANWNGSIDVAVAIGPLAAWMVAGHFAALLQASETDHAAAEAIAWLAQTAEQRTAWLAEWQALNPSLYTARLADEGLLWLQAFDLLSLWICAVCPAGGEQVSNRPAGYHISPGSALDTRIRADGSADNSRHGTVLVDPWRFDVPELPLEAAAQIVPAQEYGTTEELLAASTSLQARWLLKP